MKALEFLESPERTRNAEQFLDEPLKRESAEQFLEKRRGGATGYFGPPSLKERGIGALKTVGTIAGGLVLAPGAGIRAGVELLPTISTDLAKLVDPGSITKAGETFEQIMSTPAELLIKTPEEAATLKKVGQIFAPFEMAGEGWRLIAKEAQKATGIDVPYLEPAAGTMGEAAAVLGVGGRALKGKVKGLKRGLSAKATEARLVKAEAKHGRLGVVPEKVTLVEKPKVKVPPLAPELAKGEFEKEIPIAKAPERVEPLKAKIDTLEETQPRGVKGQTKRVIEGLREELHSPEAVYKRDPVVGSKIYKLIDRADQQKNAFLAVEGEEFVKAAGRIKEGSQSSIKIGQALDAKIDPKTLNPSERRFYGFMKKKYDFLIQKWARQAAGSEEGYLKVLRAANKEAPPYVKVSDLPDKARSSYQTLKGSLSKIRKGRPLKSLSKAESQKYWDVRRDMRDILEKKWKETLTLGEREAYDVLTKRIKNYLPHIFDKDQLLSAFKNELTLLQKKLSTTTHKGTITQYKDRIRMLQDAVTRLQKGYMVTYDSLPKYVRFRFFETRKGKAGYSFDSVKAYQTYLQGIGRKIYDEPAVRQVAELHKELDPSLKSYNKWYVRHYMGWDRGKLDDLAGAIASAQWMRTLGVNPRSAIVNLTQRLNTVAEVGVKHSLKGELMGFTKKGNELFDATGIAKEIPTVLMEGTVPAGMERVRAILGYLFNKVELGNRKHAFLSEYSKAKSMGVAEQQAIQRGIDVVHKTQFRYGKVGMPKVLTRPAGRLAGQFWSYPIKQIELITHWARNEPGKLIKYVAYAEGGNLALNRFLGIDLSNALGFGLNYGEAIKAIADVPEGDWKGFFRHIRLTFSSGGGLLPSGLGPTASGAIEVAEAIKKGRGFEALKKELTPVQGKRIYQAYQAIKNRQKGKYPMYDRRGHLMYYLTSKELATRTLGPRPSKESKQYLEWRKASMLEQERKEVLKDITRAIVDEDIEKANKLIDEYEVVPTRKMIDGEILKRKLSRKEREALKAIGKKREYQEMREGELY